MKITLKTCCTFILLSLSVVLSGCASFFSLADDNTAEPSPLVNFTPSVQVDKSWSRHLGQGFKKNNVILDIATDQQYIFVAGAKGQLFALDSKGRTLWSNNTRVQITAGPGAGEGWVAVGSADGQVLVYYADSGKLAWKKQTPNQILSPPVVAHHTLFVKNIDGHVTAFELETGKQKWVYTDPAPSLILRGDSAPAVSGQSVVMGFSDGKLFAFNLETGQLQWQHALSLPIGSTPLEQLVDIDATPVIKGSIVYAVNYHGKLAALSLDTGQVIWEHPFSSYKGVAVDDKLVYVTDTDSHVFAFDEQNGAMQWRQTKLAARVLTEPAMMGNSLVVADLEGYVHWLDKETGALSARVKNGKEAIISAPCVQGDQLYILTVSGQLTAYRLHSAT